MRNQAAFIAPYRSRFKTQTFISSSHDAPRRQRLQSFKQLSCGVARASDRLGHLGSGNQRPEPDRTPNGGFWFRPFATNFPVHVSELAGRWREASVWAAEAVLSAEIQQQKSFNIDPARIIHRLGIEQWHYRYVLRNFMDLETGRNELGAMGDSLQPQTPSRHEKSLGLLTTKFVTLLQEAKDGVLDLKAVSTRCALHVHHHHQLMLSVLFSRETACCQVLLHVNNAR